jgi:hypothetical protein
MIQKVFTVLTEFRFEAQAAVADADLITNAVNRISAAADNAVLSVIGMVNRYLTLNMSIVGMLGSAIYASENAFKSQMFFANIVSGQLDKLQGPLTTFTDRMDFANQIMKDTAKVAREFSLPQGELIGTVKSLMPVMINEGTAGTNMKNVIDMARMFQKSAPTLGVDVGLSRNQLLDMMQGRANQQDTLFQRLLSETSAFKPIKDSKNPTTAFNSMDAQKRFKMLSEAMNQFSKDADVVHSMMQLLSNKMQLMKDILFGIDGVLRPLGDAILPIIRTAFDALIVAIDTKLRPVVQYAADLLTASFGKPKTLKEVVEALAPIYATLSQFRSLKSDVRSAGNVAATIGLVGGIFSSLAWIFGKFGGAAGKIIPIIGPIVTGFAALSSAIKNSPHAAFFKSFMMFFLYVGTFGAAVAALAIFGKLAVTLSFVFKALSFVALKVLAPFLLLTAAFQIISRAVGYANVEDAVKLAEYSQRIGVALARLSKALYWIVWPFYFVADEIARAIAPLFSMSPYISFAVWGLEALADILEWIGLKLVQAYATVRGIFFLIFQLIIEIFDALKSHFLETAALIKSIVANPLSPGKWDFGPEKPWGLEGLMPVLERLGDAFVGGVDDVAEQFYKAKEDYIDRKNVRNSTTHIGKVEIRQDFKENQEPDRIAHSVVRALSDLAKNPTQARGRSMEGALYGAY